MPIRSIMAAVSLAAASAFALCGPTALGQQKTPVKLTAPSLGAANDQHGRSVAVGGDTMVVGAPFDDVGAHGDQGSVLVYRKAGLAWGLEAVLTAGDGAGGDQFGWSVAISADGTVVVGAFQDDIGANSNQGSAYVFVRTSATTWTQQSKLTAADGVAADEFGYGVGISGDTVVVGVPQDEVGANTNQGSAYVFVRSGTTWTQQARLTAADGTLGDFAGYSVSVFGDTAVMGSSSDDVGANSAQGSAYVFVRSGAVWAQQAKLTASDGVANDAFGRSVSISGSTAVIGADLHNVGANSDQGAAYVFVRSGTTWTQQAELTAGDGAAFDGFGFAVSLWDNTAVVGSWGDEVGAILNQGSAYVFVRSGTVWSQQAKLLDSDGAASDGLGRSVSVAYDFAVAGAYFDDVGSNIDQGSASVFGRAGTAWTQKYKATASEGSAADIFGISVSLSGDTAVVGASSDDVGFWPNQGSAYVFRRSGSAWAQEAHLIAADGQEADLFGGQIGISGETIVVGAHGSSGGSAYVFVRTGTTWTQQARFTASDVGFDDRFGYTVAVSGDTAVFGAILHDVGANANQGAAYVFVRSGTTWTQQAQLTASDGMAGDQFGWSIAISGDTVVVGSQAWYNGVNFNPNPGAVYVFVRSGTTWLQQARLAASDGEPNDLFGYTVAIDGDTLVAGADQDAFGSSTQQGSAYVFVRSGGAWSQQAKLVASDGGTADFFGSGVGVSGGTAIVGALGDGPTENSSRGSAYIFVRSGTAWTQRAKLVASDGAAGDHFGNFATAIEGDTALVGASWDDVGLNVNQGSAWVFRGFGTWTGADFNNSGTVTVQDLFDFLAAWFAASTSADLNGSGTVTVQDLFDFLGAWFGSGA